MELFKASINRFQNLDFDAYTKTAFTKQDIMSSVDNCARVESYPVDIRGEQFSSTRLLHPPSYLVGGFVGSKICEHKNGAVSYSNILGQIIHSLQPVKPKQSCFFQPSKCQGDIHLRGKVEVLPQSYAQVTSPIKSVASSSPTVVISSPIVMVSDVTPISSPAMPNQKEKELSPATCRTVSESSESSWASVSQLEDRFDVLSSNPWLSNIVVCVSDSDSDGDDSDSDWDCVDFQSENGEVISDFKWNGESLSPISSPISRTPPNLATPLDDYDSDESDGILISCGHGYLADSEEEARERRLAEERVQDANHRWEQNLLKTADETDGPRKPSQQSKQVNKSEI